MRLRRRYEMECAHYLTEGLKLGHKCRRIHGHRYVLTVEVTGVVADDGMVIEYADLDAMVLPIIAAVDHYDLNSLSGRCASELAVRVARNPTVELLAEWFAFRIQNVLKGKDIHLSAIYLEEDSKASVVWP